MNTITIVGSGVAGASRLRIGSSVAVVSPGGRGYELRGNAAVVLACVALEGRACRQRMSALLWPESEPAQARSNLRVLMHRINQRFGSELLVGTEHLELDASLAQVELHDADAVLAALAAGGAARCELLADAGVEAHAGEDLRAWLGSARQRLKQAQLAHLGEALTEAFALARHERAVALARACVQLDPLSEHRHRRLMEALARAGDRAAALSAYEDCKALLTQHLGVLPSQQTRAVQLRILQQQALGSAQGPQPLPSLNAEEPAPPCSPPFSLPCAPTHHPLVEREAVLAQAHAALGRGVHVVVQGEPGVGKTRLLRQLVATAEGRTEHVALHAALEHAPYGALAQLLQEVQPRRRPRVGVAEQVELARLAPLAFAEVKASEAALSAPRLHAALWHWFASLGDAGVRVLVIDDVQYADAASQAAFSSLLGNAAVAAERAPALLVAHRSAEVQVVLDDAVTQAQAQRRALRLELPRLTLSGVQALLAAMDAVPRTGEPGALAEHLHKRTGGNPLFVIELARQALEQGDAVGTGDLQALLGGRLERCSATAQQLAAVAAVAPEHFTVELAAAVSGQTALALMPAWRELEQRGLFAGHGLAHDLIKDAVLVALPQPILRVLHAEVAQYLESQGRQGAAVLRHWMGAGDADRALPHAAHQLYAASAAGLPTMEQQLELLGLMERASDPVLLANLWLTCELDNSVGDALPAETWLRVRALRQRVERLPEHAAHAGWIAHEMSQDHWRIGRNPKLAYEALAPAAQGMPQHGIARSFVEYQLALLAAEVTGDPRTHLGQARHALAGLPEQPAVKRLRLEVDDVASIFLDPVEGLRMLAARWRDGRRRHDQAAVEDACMRMGFLHGVLGSASQSLRDYCRAARLHAGSEGDIAIESFETPFTTGKHALNAGNFALAGQLLMAGDDRIARMHRPVFMALLCMRMGNVQQAEQHAAQIDHKVLSEHYSAQITYFHTRAVMDQVKGLDPLPALREQLDLARGFGVSGLNLALMEWEVALQAQPAAERLQQADALLHDIRDGGRKGARLAKALLEIAETHAESDVRLSRSMAAEAARWFRRGFANSTLYLPEYLVRCARLLRESDPRDAAALVHVAQRWVKRALQQLPPGAAEGFTRHVVVNRLLLSGDEQDVYLAPLH